MEVLEGTIMPRYNFGWYFRPSIQTYEFWWMGNEPMIRLTAEMLPCVPLELSDEIKMAISLKGDKALLD